MNIKYTSHALPTRDSVQVLHTIQFQVKTVTYRTWDNLAIKSDIYPLIQGESTVMWINNTASEPTKSYLI